MENLQKYQYFLLDIVPLIKENLQKAKQDKDDEYNQGRVFAYFDVLSLIQIQAKSFGIDIKELELKDDLVNELFY